ncbi:MAG: Glyceraldehyde-3-phosphate dehydrogenase [candidate division WWE3 bacterium GW2011_GWA1_46_21]|uniref:Glyceraldehyde-3-phosphate dehydrogenase n=4 Tax=Katanobacteria TaxID=422282 RepID=A0A0G1RPR9_UNCKA|nr:MAG: Glyceraldehyde-3-phosphate dehydrogenase [candidate division WWE3 bacterium GW2011_GWA1_46_21]KKU49423.1 MAG: Glyceraldehyde-3-phosphate dehydrogenase [candidate division WWE3 bacterium GW2011_GWA2_46_9]KKU51412.1 MAG: Glyceraldehyde-3-phosphate dehydrogenase [candidate division WWE3 bacterium GW2011_GWC1_47_10]KKU57706.1 MAG: Glyceraldehyde-3-phosphate dehydrogenase [candidate division WWE3 bacterium GW2011_GWB1_47_11]
MPVKLAINGFGRIGRAAFKIAFDNPQLEIVAINDLTEVDGLAYLLKHDTVYGLYEKDVTVGDKTLVVAGRSVKVLGEKDPANLPWAALGVDVVLECTGRFTKDGAAKAHIQAGAKKVIVSAPTKGSGGVQTFLKGANHDQYIGQNVISNASCTTNCIAPVISVVHKKFGIIKSVMTTVHAITSSQNLVDGPVSSGDFRRARAAGYNIVPTTTGAAIAAAEAIPDLKGKFDGVSLRVPVAVGSICDITMLVEKKTTVDEVNKAFVEAKDNFFYENVLAVATEPIVSSDIIKSPYSAIVDLAMTKVVDGDLVKVMAWYDNEWGYSSRLVDMALMII